MSSDDRSLLILDLDETLLHASEKRLNREADHRMGPYYLYQRPFLNEFLDRVAIRFQLAVWSSSSPDYAQAAVDLIFRARSELRFVWGRNRCTQRYDSEMQTAYYLKDLRKTTRLGFDMKRILIIDDTPKKCERNYGNAVYVPEFTGDPDDSTLLRLGPYLVSLSDKPDVRTIEKRYWLTQD